MEFGSEELHLALRAACDAQDLSRAAELLYEPVQKTAGSLFFKKREFFVKYTREDREDAIHDALLYMLERLREIAYPREEGVPKYAYYARFVFHGLIRRRSKVMRAAAWDSLDQPIPSARGTGDDKEQSLLDIVPSAKDQPESAVLTRDLLCKALRAFFSLPNEPETLAAVGWVIMNDVLGDPRVSMKEYVEKLNGTPVADTVRRLEGLMAEYGLDARLLEPLKARLCGSGAGARFSGVTEGKLSNRKNSVTTKMRKDEKLRE